MQRVLSLLTVVALLAGFSSVLSAQDFGVDWMDRVAHETEEEADQLTAKPVTTSAYLGELYYYDNNIFLEENDEDGDSIWVTFAEGRLEYAEPKFDVVADLLVNYNSYVEEDDESGDEERLFLRARYVASGVSVELSEVYRNETSPVDSTLVDRAERIVSDTTPVIVVQATKMINVEITYRYQLVEFKDDIFENLNNTNTRAGVALVYATSKEQSIVLDAGIIDIDYDEDTAPPDSDGVYARVGTRGELTSDLSGSALLGYTKVESDDFVSGAEGEERTTGDVEIGLTYEGIEKLVLNADYSRRIGFAAYSPFQTIDAVTLLGKYDLMDTTKLRFRIGYNQTHNDSSTGTSRDYLAIGVSADHRITDMFSADAGITYRSGGTDGTTTSGDFDDLIYHLGVVAKF